MTAPEATVCPTCLGEGYVDIELPLPEDADPWLDDADVLFDVPCPECRCAGCGTEVYTRGAGLQLCNDCADEPKDEKCLTRRTTPTEPTTTPQSHDAPTGIPTLPIRVDVETPQAEENGDA